MQAIWLLRIIEFTLSGRMSLLKITGQEYSHLPLNVAIKGITLLFNQQI